MAKKIETAQGPDMETGWLQDWGKDVPNETSGTGGTIQVPHHDHDARPLLGAIEMAQTEQADGENPTL